MKKKALTLLLILFTNLNLAQWVQVSNGMGNLFVHEIASNTNTIFAGTFTSGIFRSTDYGSNWIQTSINNQSVPALAVSGNTIFAGIAGGDLYRSTNNGLNWNSVYLFNQTVHTIAISGNIIFVGTYQTGIFRSSNNGMSWTQTSVNNSNVYCIIVNGNYVYAGSQYNGVYRSTDLGLNWSQTSLNNEFVQSLAVNGNSVFAGTTDPSFGLFRSTDNGLSWSQPSLGTRQIFALASSGNNIFAGTYQFGVYVSSDNGGNWVQKLEGLPQGAWICTLSILNSYLYAGTYTPGNGVWRRPISELVNAQSPSTEIPVHYKLYQNYPNPFNPTTKIRFEISGGSVIQTFLSVYDILGHEVTTLVNEELQPGTYEVEWNASGLPSGVYFYKLTAGNFVQSKKMLLLK